MFQANSATASPGAASHVLSQRINEDQEILSFREDEQRLTDLEGPSSYGAVSSPAVRDAGDQCADQQDGAATRAGCGMYLYLSVLVAVVLSGLVALSGVVRSTSGSVGLETDARFPFTTTTKHPLRPGKLWGAVELPYPTGAWWLNLVIGEGDYPVAPLPYAIESTDRGVGVSYSAMRRVESAKRVQDAYAPDLNVSAAEGVVGRHIVKYDNLTVTIQHDTEGEGYFQTLAARGSPYMTFEFALATPRIKSNGNILEVDGEAAKVGSSMHGTTFKLALSNWETWLVFTSESVTWNLVSEHEVQMEGPFSGIVRVAVLPHPWDEDSEKTLTRHAYAYPRGGRVNFAVNGDRMEMRYEWAKDGFGDLLMMALPHHVDIMGGVNGEDAAFLMKDSYQSIKGPMTGIVGSVWTMRDNLTDIAWTARTTLREASVGIDDPLLSLSWEKQVKAALAEDLHTTLPTAPDVYGFGKELARMARLALIADELGDGAARDTALATVSAYLTPWMKNANEDLLVYDKTWGGIVTKDGLNDVNADFGNAWYNDHTYHYGYLIYAAAVLTKFHPAFHRTYKKQLEFLVEDIAGRGGAMAKHFPVARQKDFYDGHSWTSGLFSQGDGKSQESVSESINAYYGVYLLGLAVGDTGMRDWGRVLLAMEMRGARKYWQMPDNNGVYDSFFSSRRMVGMVASLEAVQLTWFGDNVEFVHCINMLPFTPITEELLGRDFMEQEWPVLETAFDNRDLGPQWAGFVSLAGAVVLPVEAWANITEIEVFDAGNSKTNSLYWIATRPQGAMEAYNETAFKSEVKVQACAANSACNARGLTQEKLCCPAADGGWLGCCPSGDGIPEGPSACSSNPQCLALNLKTGLCCPSVSGEMLSCCEQAKSPESSKDKNVDPQALCSSNEGCLALQLEGTCCPTTGGTYLGCCGANHVPSASTGNSSSPEAPGGDERACSSHPGCASLGGDCCPAPDGTMLECCS